MPFVSWWYKFANVQEAQSRENACDGASNAVLEKTQFSKPKLDFHMNKTIDYILNFVLELKTFILSINTQFGLLKGTKTTRKFYKGSECMSSEEK